MESPPTRANDATAIPPPGPTPPIDPRWIPPQALSPPGFDFLEEIGRGGMGVVFKTRQGDLNRIVALKMILSGQYADQAELARFRAEAETAARLQHPNIVQIFEVGAHDGRPYLSLEYCPGGSLDRKLDGTPLLPRAAADLVAQLAGALQLAHEAHVVHRDLKPANVLLAADGTPKLTDFGIAKRLNQHTMTPAGGLLGTPPYMPPEQARGESVGPAADIYSLGAVLYECLTGRPPFLAATRNATLQQVENDDPVPPSRLNPAVPRDLNTICLKCLAKAPADRYASAADFAADLRRFLAGEPVKARPVGWAEAAWKWSRRHPAVAGLLAAVAAITAASLTAITLLWRDAVHKTGLAVAAEGRAEDRARMSAYAYQMSQAARALDDRDGGAALDALDACPEGQRGWEHGHLMLRVAALAAERPSRPLHTEALAVSPDGRRLALGGKTGAVHLWDLSPLRQVATLPAGGGTVYSVHFGPTGLLLASSRGEGDAAGEVRVWDAGGRLLYSVPTLSEQPCARFTADGRHLVGTAGGRLLSVWEAATGRLVRRLTAPEDVVCLAPHPRGGIVLGCKSALLVCEVPSGKVVAAHPAPGGRFNAVAVSADGGLVAAADAASGQAHVWDARTWERLHTLMGDGDDKVTSLAFGPAGGALVAVGHEKAGVVVHDLARGEAVHRSPLEGWMGGEALAFTADGSALIHGVGTGARLTPLGRPSVALTPTNVHPWAARLPDAFRGLPPLVSFAPGEADAGATIRERRSGLVVASAARMPVRGEAATSPDGTLVAEASGRAVLLRSASAPDKVWGILQGHGGPVDWITFSPDGTRLATSSGGEIKVWAVATALELLTLRVADDSPHGLAFDAETGALVHFGSAPAVFLTAGSGRAGVRRLAAARLIHAERREDWEGARLLHVGFREADPASQALRRRRLAALARLKLWPEMAGELAAGTAQPPDGARPLDWWLSEGAIDAAGLPADWLGDEELWRLVAGPSWASRVLLAWRDLKEGRGGSGRRLEALASEGAGRADLLAVAAAAHCRDGNHHLADVPCDRLHRLHPKEAAGWHGAASADGDDATRLWHLGRLVALGGPGRAGAHAGRAAILSRRGRRLEAADELARAVRAAPADHSLWARYAEACHEAGGVAAYRAACRGLLRVMPADRDTAAEAARVCTLGPGAAEDAGRLVRLADWGGGRALRGAALLRAGRPADALRAIGKPAPGPTLRLALLAAGRHPAGQVRAALTGLGLAPGQPPFLIPWAVDVARGSDDWRGLILPRAAGAAAIGLSGAGEGGSGVLSSGRPNMIGD